MYDEAGWKVSVPPRWIGDCKKCRKVWYGLHRADPGFDPHHLAGSSAGQPVGKLDVHKQPGFWTFIVFGTYTDTCPIIPRALNTETPAFPRSTRLRLPKDIEARAIRCGT